MADNPERRDPPSQESLQDVLRLAVSNTPANPDMIASQSHIPAMDPERREWLSNVLSNLSNNSITISNIITEEIKKCIAFLHSSIETYNNDKTNTDILTSIENTLEELTDHTGSIDNANDFEKMGGFSLLPQLMAINREGIQCKTADLIAELVQNNPHCQTAALECSLLNNLLDLVDQHELETVKIKALYALSCLIRQNPKAQELFENLDGFSVLLRAMQTNVKKLRTKISFLLNSLCHQQSRYRDLLYKMGFIELIIGLLHSEHDDSHEHLLSVLLSMVKDHLQSKIECRRNDLGLESLLNERISLINNQESFQEELDYCKQLLDICFAESLTPELER